MQLERTAYCPSCHSQIRLTVRINALYVALLILGSLLAGYFLR